MPKNLPEHWSCQPTATLSADVNISIDGHGHGHTTLCYNYSTLLELNTVASLPTSNEVECL